MKNPFDQFDEGSSSPTTAPAAVENPFDAFDKPENKAITLSAEANPFDAFDAPAPESNPIADVALRTARGIGRGVGGAIEAVGRMNRNLGATVDRIHDVTTEAIQGFPLTAEQRATRAAGRGETERRFGQPDRAAIAAGTAIKDRANEIAVDPARDREVKSAVADLGGQALPVIAAGLVNPAAGFAAAVGETATATRDQALAAGDTPEIADAKSVLASAATAPLAAVPGLPVRATAGAAERLATHAASGALLNAASEAAMSKATEGEVDWGRVKQAGTIGAAFGLVLGVPEAIALRRTFRTAGSHEGKTLGAAVTEIAAEQQRPPAEIAAEIHQMAGLTPEAPTAKPAEAAPAAEPTNLFSARAEANHARPPEPELIPAGEMPFNLAGEAQVEAAAPHAPAGEDSGLFLPSEVRSTPPTALDRANAAAHELPPETFAPAQVAPPARANERVENAPAGAPLSETQTPAEITPPASITRAMSSDSAAGPSPQEGRAVSDGGQAAPTVARQSKGATMKVGHAPDGTPDLLTAIEDLGGAPGPKKGARTPEYDGYNEAFGRGAARLLRRAGSGGIDTFIPQLEAHGYKFDSIPEFYAAVAQASENRDKLRRSLGSAEYGAKFDAALLDNAGRRAEQKAKAPVAVDELGVGATFKIRGEPVRVTEVTETNAVKIEDGVKRTLPEGSMIYPDHGSLKNPEVKPEFLSGDAGFISPAALLPIARSAVGGALGYATGDTPEERVRNALLGMGFGAIASPALARRLSGQVLNSPVGSAAAARAQTSLARLRRFMAPQSFLPAEIRQAVRWGEQSSHAITQAGLSLTADLHKAISGTGNLAARGSAADAVQAYLTGRAPLAGLPPHLRPPAERVRIFVDALTDRAVAEGVVTGTMAQTFLSNRGSYLRRSYEIFLNPDFRPNPAHVQNAIAAVAQSNGVARAEAEGIVAGILDRNQRAALGDFLLGRGKIAGKDVSSLVRRQDLLPEIRTMLGEVSDPILAANQTIPRMARLLEQDAAQRRMRAIGRQLGVFSDVQSLAHPSPLVADGSRTHDLLSGLYAAPEIADALQRVGGSGRLALVPEALWRALTTTSSLAKAAKTVGNPESYMPNFLGGLVQTLGNGNFRLAALGRGLALGAEELGALRNFAPNAPGRAALRREIFDLHRLGLLGESTAGGDLLRTIESSYWAAISNKAQSIWRLPTKVYGSIDDLTRYAAYRSELARYSAAHPTMPAAEVQRLAAEVTRATMPTYSAIPKFVKQLSTAGLAPPFVNFTWEVFRNTLNTARIGMRDLQQGMATGNAALRNAGAVRLASLTAMLGVASAYGVSKLSRDTHKVSDQQDAAVRYFSPPWNRDGTLQYHTPAATGGPIEFSNLSYLIPHAIAWQALDAGRRGIEEDQALPHFLRALSDQFGANPVKDSVVLSPLVGALTGRDTKTGQRITRTEVEPTALDRAKYFAQSAFKPLIADWIDHMQKAKAGEQGDYGRVYSVEEQWRRLGGIRQQTMDPAKAVPWKARQLGGQFNEAADLYELQVKRSPDPIRREQMYGHAEAERKRLFAEMQTMIKHARALGVDDDKTITAMRAARISAETILGVLENRYTALEREKPKTVTQYFAELQTKRADERGAALAQIYRENPLMGKALIGQIKDSAKGRTEHDKLILSLGIEDGARARYLRDKLQTLAGAEARQALLLDLRRKGILTDTVFAQMAGEK